jgi:hypothetical protein
MGFRDRFAKQPSSSDSQPRPVADSRIDKPEVIDLVSMNAAEDEVTLHLIAEQPWDVRGEGTAKLQAKLKNYVTFAADGQLHRDYPEARGKRIRIHVDSEYPLGDLELQLLDAAREHWCAPEQIELSSSSRRAAGSS